MVLVSAGPRDRYAAVVFHDHFDIQCYSPSSSRMKDSIMPI